MPSSTRANSQARRRVIDQLMEDHQRVKKAYRAFQKLDAAKDPDACSEIVHQVLQDLQVHTRLEEELLYPMAREALDAALVDEAEVEHESAHALIEQLQGMNVQDDKYAARFTVLCEYVLHHVKEEEKEMFPQLEKARGLHWESVAEAMDSRRAALQAQGDGAPDGTSDDDHPTQPEPWREQRGAQRERPLTGITSSGAAGGRRMGD